MCHQEVIQNELSKTKQAISNLKMEGSCGLLGGKGKGKWGEVLQKAIFWNMEEKEIEEVKRKRHLGEVEKENSEGQGRQNLS